MPKRVEGKAAIVVGGNGDAIFTLIGFTGLYFVLGLLFLFLVGREIAHGPDEDGPHNIGSEPAL